MEQESRYEGIKSALEEACTVRESSDKEIETLEKQIEARAKNQPARFFNQYGTKLKDHAEDGGWPTTNLMPIMKEIAEGVEERIPEGKLVHLRVANTIPRKAKWKDSEFQVLTRSHTIGWRKGDPVMEALPLALHDHLLSLLAVYIGDKQKHARVAPGLTVE